MSDGEKLKNRLEETGMSKSEFAKRIGTSSQYVYILFRTKQFRKERRKQIEQVLNFKFDKEVQPYQIEYFELLKKYTECLEENIKLKDLINKC